MQQTNNYGLNQWEVTDRIQMEDFNGDNSKVDAALKTLAEQVAGKADSATVSSLSAKVNTKAAQSDLTAEQTARANADNTEKAAREAADEALGARVDALAPRAGAQLLKTVELGESTSEFTVPMNDIDWGQWKAVHILFDITSTSYAQAEILSGSYTIAYVCGNTSTDRSEHTYFGHLIFYPMFDSRMKVELLSLQEAKLVAVGCQYQSFTQLQVKFSKDIQALPSTEITVLGEK